MQNAIRDRFGADSQVNVEEMVTWLEWPPEEVFDPAALDNVMKSESVSIREIYFIGEFTLKDGYVTSPALATARKIKLVEGTLPESGKATLEIKDFREADDILEVMVAEPIEPEVYYVPEEAAEEDSHERE